MFIWIRFRIRIGEPIFENTIEQILGNIERSSIADHQDQDNDL